jgi:hypothetical protein
MIRMTISGITKIRMSPINPKGSSAGATKLSKTQVKATSRIAPSSEIQRASVNFAFSGPDTILPANQRISEPKSQMRRNGITIRTKISTICIVSTPLVKCWATYTKPSLKDYGMKEGKKRTHQRVRSVVDPPMG